MYVLRINASAPANSPQQKNNTIGLLSDFPRRTETNRSGMIMVIIMLMNWNDSSSTHGTPFHGRLNVIAGF
jgi:hypothetical protein